MYKTFTIHSSVAIAAVLLAGSVHAQNGSTIVQSAALHCSTHAGSGAFNAISWSVGASMPAQSNGATGREPSASVAQLGSFNLVKAFDECSPALFGALVTGSILQTVTITDRGVDPVNGGPQKSSPVTIQLQDVRVSQFMLSDGSSAAGPAESISLVYSKITITNLNNGSKFCWDNMLRHTCS